MLFKRLDHDSKGVIDISDFERAINNIQLSSFMGEDWVQQYFSEMSKEIQDKGLSLEKVLQKLGVVDKGYFTITNFEKCVLWFFPDIKKQQISKLFSFIDNANTGRIDLHVFLKVCCDPLLGAPRIHSNKHSMLPSDVMEKLCAVMLEKCYTLEDAFEKMSPGLSVSAFKKSLKDVFKFEVGVDWNQIFNTLDMTRTGVVHKTEFIKSMQRYSKGLYVEENQTFDSPTPPKRSPACSFPDNVGTSTSSKFATPTQGLKKHIETGMKNNAKSMLGGNAAASGRPQTAHHPLSLDNPAPAKPRGSVLPSSPSLQSVALGGSSAANKWKKATTSSTFQDMFNPVAAGSAAGTLRSGFKGLASVAETASAVLDRITEN
eukprot:gene766-1053_t